MKSNLNIKTAPFVLLIAFFALAGCCKDEEQELSKTELLTRQWSIVSVDGKTENLEWDTVTMKFETNGKFSILSKKGGFTVTSNGEWIWGPNQASIKVDRPLIVPVIWSIEKLTADALWLYDEDDSFIQLEIKK